MDNIIQKIKNNKELHEKVYHICDIELYDEMRSPDDRKGEFKFNMEGMSFGADASGGEFILLNDNSIGLMSSECECGRIAESMKELFTLLINVSSFFSYLCPDIYKDKNFLYRYAKQIEKEHRDNMNKYLSEDNKDYDALKKETADALGIDIYENIDENVLLNFYRVAVREPLFKYTYKDDDGNEFISENIISRPMRDWMKDKANMEK